MKFLSTYLALWLAVLLLSFSASAQTGSWNPPGAQLAYPRTLTTLAELGAVRSRLTEPERELLYNQVVTNAFLAVPANNTSISDRRKRAQQAKNAAFVLLINRQTGGTSPLTATQEQTLKTNAKTLLQNINTTVESVLQNTEWQWRSKELIDFLVAYDLLRGAGMPADSLIPEKARLQLFANKLYSASMQYSGFFYSTTKNNHALMTAAALGMAAVVLNDAGGTAAADQPQNWINVGMYTIDNVLWRDAKRQSQPGILAGYAEGPYYFKYAFLNCLPFFRAMGHFLPATALPYTYAGNTRNIQNPYFDPNYDLLYEWAAAITLPDGRLPALEDSFIDTAMPELALTGKSRYVKPLWLNNLNTGQSKTLSSQLVTNVDMRAAWLCALTDPTPASDTLVALPAAGNLIFRSDTTHSGNYFHLYGKNGLAQTNSGGHNQADATSFTLYSGGQLLALDAGYLSYALRTQLGNAANHNMILVDGAGPAMGTAGSANEAEAFIRNAFGNNDLAYGEVATSYLGTSITRKAISVRGEYYLLSDFVSSPNSHQYTWQLHGYGLENGTTASGIFTSDFANQQAQWQKNGVGLSAKVTATGGNPVYGTGIATHELSYETTQNHSVMEVQQTGASTEFVSVLQPFTLQPQPVTTLALPGISGAVISTSAGGEDLIMAKSDTTAYFLSLPGQNIPVGSNANLTFISVDAAGKATQWLIENGSKLSVNDRTILETANRITASWTQTSAETASGYVSDATTLTVKTAAPESVTGNGVSSWKYENGMLTINLSKPTDFIVQNMP
ncbi:MAG: hypothetical protein EOP49_15700, partial [Sphingobacteriales bacterium]